MSNYTITKIVDGEVEGLRVENASVELYRFINQYEINLLTVRIEKRQYEETALVGYAPLKISTFNITHEEKEKGTYLEPVTDYIKVKIRPSRQDIAEDGNFTLYKFLLDSHSELSIEIRKEIYDELYELVKTRQLNILRMFIDFSDDEDEIIYQVYGKDRASDAPYPRIPIQLAMDSGSVNGYVAGIDYTSKSLDLSEMPWMELDELAGMSANEVRRFETYNDNRQKLISKLRFELSLFEKLVVGLLGFIALLVLFS